MLQENRWKNSKAMLPRISKCSQTVGDSFEINRERSKSDMGTGWGAGTWELTERITIACFSMGHRRNVKSRRFENDDFASLSRDFYRENEQILGSASFVCQFREPPPRRSVFRGKELTRTDYPARFV